MMNFNRTLYTVILIEFIIVVTAYLTDGITLTALQKATRFSGRFSLFIFSFIFIYYDDLTILYKWLSDKFYLIFAIVHGVHLIELLLFVYSSGATLVPYRLVGGFVAYLLVFLMPLFHYQYQLGRMNTRKFLKIESFYIYYVWFIFFMTYLSRVQGVVQTTVSHYFEYVVLLGYVSLLLGYRLMGLFKTSENNP